MDRQHIVQFIRTVPLFHQFDNQRLEQLAESFEVRSFEAGDVVVSPDAQQRELFIAVQGEFQVLVRQESIDLEVELTQLYPGDYLGDLALITGRGSPAITRAITPGLVLCLSKARFDELFDSSPDFARQICWSLANAVLSAVDHLGVIPHVKLEAYQNLESAATALAPRICRACRCLVVDQSGGDATVALVDPSDGEIRTFLSHALQPLRTRWVAISEQDFEAHATRLLKDDSAANRVNVPFDSLQYSSPDGEPIPLVEPGGSDLLARILTEAIRSGASDIHLEPGADQGYARLRIDGLMTPASIQINRQEQRSLVSQIKVMSNIDITKGFLPQDGNFSIHADQRNLEIRVSTIPCHGGEKAVLRLVLPNPEFGWLENLILSPPVCQLAADIFHTPHGLVLVTGPTGSGKTTTLYAALNSIWRKNPNINVVTIEDPIEYDLSFATQTQINRSAGLHFPTVMRALLRQDPDVILVGEIRDEESAAIALDAATTGHLVLSSLHTHSAMETLARLRQLNVKPYLLADALQGVVSQRLALRQRPELCEETSPDDPAIARLRSLHVLPSDWSGTLRRPPSGPDGKVNSEEQSSGRIGVFEMLAVTPALRNLIECDAPTGTMLDRLERNSFASMADYSRFLLERGLIAPESAEGLFSRFDAHRTPRRHEGDLALA